MIMFFKDQHFDKSVLHRHIMTILEDYPRSTITVINSKIDEIYGKSTSRGLIGIACKFLSEQNILYREKFFNGYKYSLQQPEGDRPIVVSLTNK